MPGVARHVFALLAHGFGFAFHRFAVHGDRLTGLHHAVFGFLGIRGFNRVLIVQTFGVGHFLSGRAFIRIAVGIDGDIGVFFKAGIGAVGIRLGRYVLFGIITLRIALN